MLDRQPCPDFGHDGGTESVDDSLAACWSSVITWLGLPLLLPASGVENLREYWVGACEVMSDGVLRPLVVCVGDCAFADGIIVAAPRLPLSFCGNIGRSGCNSRLYMTKLASCAAGRLLKYVRRCNKGPV